MTISDRLHTSVFALTMAAALSLTSACDSKDGGDEKAADKKEAGASEQAKSAEKDVAEMTAELGKGEDIKYSCAGNMAKYKALAASKDESEKKAHAALAKVCYVDMPTAQIKTIREQIKAGKVESMAIINLKTTIEGDEFPKDGDAAKVAAEAKTVMEVEVPLSNLNTHLETAKKEKEEGKSVSMGCIKAKQVVDKSGEALGADDKGKAAVASFNETCPAK
ncbi:MAG: hypothetical protein ACRBN8_38450 [Nannocystales bacterium]